MKRAFCLFLCAMLACTALCLPTQAASQTEIVPAYTPSTQEEARCIPLTLRQGYLEEDGTLRDEHWQTLWNPATAEMALELSIAARTLGEGDAWKHALEDYGYTQIQYTEDNEVYANKEYTLVYWEVDDAQIIVPFRAVNAAVGIQEVNYNGQTRYAVGLVFRGSNDWEDWAADLARAFSDEEGFHQGFSENAADFYHNMSDSIVFEVGDSIYTLSQIYDEMKQPNSKFCMVVMGHSLGAALTNVFVGRDLYNHGVHPSNVVGYSTATPRTAPGGLVDEYPYNNIFSIINADDLVPVLTVDDHQRYGQEFFYYPDDDFRKQCYGQEYVEEHPDESHLFWQTIGFVGAGAKPHDSKITYTPILDIVTNEIKNSTVDEPSVYTDFSTCGYNDWGLEDTVFTPHTFGDFTKDVHVGSTLIFENGGVLQVEGNVSLGTSMSMHHPDDYLLVGGDLDLSWGVHQDHPEHLTAGTVELKGNLSTGKHSFWNVPYHATGTHRTVFSGTKEQNIHFYGEQISVANLYIRNPQVTIFGMTYARLAEDAAITNSEDLYVHELDLNGYALEQEGAMGVHSLTMNGGSLAVNGDLEVGMVQSVDGQITVKGCFVTDDTLPFNGGQMWVEGDCYLPCTLTMQNEEDYLQVGGLFTIFARDWDEITDDHLSAGTVELKGDFEFDDCGICTDNAYHETGTHKTILSGEGEQTVWFNNAGAANRFENLCIRNPEVSLFSVKDVRLGEDATVTASGDDPWRRWQIDGTLDPGGHTLTVNAADWANEDYAPLSVHAIRNPLGGKVDVNGDMTLQDGTLQGELNVTGDLTLGSVQKGRLVFDGGRLTVGGDCYLPNSLVMDSDDDYLFVGGTLTVETDGTLPEDHLKAGTVELRGDLRVCDSRGQVTYCATGSHHTVFSGTGEQKVSMGAMYPDKRLQACLRNPDTILESVHTLELMEGGALNQPSRCYIHGTLDLNGYPLRLKGDFGMVKEVTGGQPIGVETKKTETGDPVVTVKCPELPETESSEEPAAIHVLFAGFDKRFRMVVYEILTFTSESEAQQTVTLALEKWSNCKYISAFWLENDFAPFCTAMDLGL